MLPRAEGLGLSLAGRLHYLGLVHYLWPPSVLGCAHSLGRMHYLGVGRAFCRIGGFDKAPHQNTNLVEQAQGASQ